MELTNEERERVSKLPSLFIIVLDTLMRWVRQLIYGECDEDTITNMAGKINASTQGYVHEDNQVTVDEAMRILGFGQNRVGCINLLRKHGIVNETINNNHIGYNRDKIIALKNKLRKEYDERKLKQLNKERRNKSKGGFN